MSELKPKVCPVCKGQSGGIGSDGVENDCMECFKRDMKAATPRVEACIDAVMARFTGESKAALARYYEEVHQHLAPLARNLELELAEVKAELARRTQPEATKQAQDLSAAILALPCTVPEKLMGHQAAVFGYKRGFNSAMSGASQLAIAFAALASPADALVAGDRVDADRYRYLRDHGTPTTDATIGSALLVYRGLELTSLLPDDLDAAIDAARQSTPTTDAPQAKGSEVDGD